MKLPLIALLLFSILSASAQKKQNVYFIKSDGRYVDSRDSADFVRVVQEPDSGSKLYNVLEFYAKGGERKLVGKSSRIDPPELQGSCATYYKNGKRKELSNYADNILYGDVYGFYPNGAFYYQLKYPARANPFDHLSNDHYLVLAEKDSTGKDMVTDGNGYYKGYDDKFKNVVDEGQVKNGEKDGAWKGLDEGSKLSFTETYDNGKLISGTSIKDKGDTVTYTGSREVEPGYKGGLMAFYRFIAETIHYPDYEKEHNIQGKVILSFIVERDGSISNIKILHSATPGLADEAIRGLKESKKWIPGTQYGRKVRAMYTIPVNFALTTD